MSSYLNSKYNMSSVLEKYVGRKPQLVLIEKELVKLVDRIKTDVYTVKNTSGSVTGRDLNNSIENKKIERLFKEFFGLKTFVLNWLWTPIPDAHTMVKSFQILDWNYEKDKDGRDFNSKLFVGVNVSTGLVTLMNMEANEIMAIILHEIGHSFDKSLSHVLASSSPLFFNLTPEGMTVGTGMFSAVIADLIRMNALYTHARTNIENIKDVFKPLVKINNYVNEVSAKVFSFLPTSIMSAGNGIVNAFLNPFRTVFLYNVEKRADGFAVDYGYGMELSSALNKLDRSIDHPKMKVPVLNWIHDMDDLIGEMILEPLTGYPSLHNRQTSALDRLRQSSKDKDLDPRVRKELESQIKQFEKYYDDYMNLDKNDNKRFISTWSYRRFVNKFFGGKLDIRELIYNMTKDSPKNHGYVKEYDKFQKELKEKNNTVK